MRHNMELWRVEAKRIFPELSEQVSSAESMYQLWNELTDSFARAYEAGNRSQIAKIYGYARWCCDQPRGERAEDDLLSCVMACFFEDIPTIPAALKDMPNWWSLAEVQDMKETFSCMVGPEGYAEILRQYAA